MHACVPSLNLFVQFDIQRVMMPRLGNIYKHARLWHPSRILNPTQARKVPRQSQSLLLLMIGLYIVIKGSRLAVTISRVLCSIVTSSYRSPSANT